MGGTTTLSEHCRLCGLRMLDKKNKHNLFNGKTNNKADYAVVLEELTGGPVSRGDLLKAVCGTCRNRLQRYKRYKDEVQRRGDEIKALALQNQAAKRCAESTSDPTEKHVSTVEDDKPSHGLAGTTEPQEPASVEHMQATGLKPDIKSNSLDQSVESSLQMKMSSPVPARTISINQEPVAEIEVEIEDHLDLSECAMQSACYVTLDVRPVQRAELLVVFNSQSTQQPLGLVFPSRVCPLEVSRNFLYHPMCTKEVAPEQQERSPSLVQEEPETLQNKDEQGKLLQRPLEADGSMMTLLANKSGDADENKNLRCTVCSKVFASKTNLKQHTIIHTGEYPFTCTVCGKGCRDISRLKSHMMTHREKPFRCAVCEKTFRLNTSLKLHMRIHTGGKHYTCEVCGKGFSKSYVLEGHARAHTGEKPFTCKVCGRGFSFNGTLKTHMRIHTGEKPFPCAVCEKRFRKKTHLKLHMMIHTGEYTFHCTVCNKGCCTGSDLKKHMMIHTGEKPFPCAVCKKRFSKNFNLKKHMRIHAGAEQLRKHI